MKQLTVLLFLMVPLFSYSQEEEKSIFQPPIPTELMVGNEYSLFKMIVTKQIKGNQLKFYNLLSYEVDYADLEATNFFNQTVVFYDINTKLRAGLGLNYKSFGGAKPIFSILFSKFGKTGGYVIQPTLELHGEGAKELFALFEYIHQNNKNFQPYFRLDAFTAFLKKHDYSYFNWRVGVNRKSLRFGPALNVQYFGTQGANRLNWGGFVQVLIF